MERTGATMRDRCVPGTLSKEGKVMFLKLLTSCCFATFLLSSCSFFPFLQSREDFVRVKGTHLMLEGKPHYFVGANMWYGCYIGSAGETGDRPRLVRELDALQANHFINLRILAASEEGYIKHSVRPVIQRTPGTIDDRLLQGLDFLLSEMAKRRMHAVLYLNNYWEWSGGMTQYNVWTGAKPVDPDDTTQGWGAFMDFSASFYANEPAQRMFREYVQKIVTRTNTCNGRKYSEDPTIMAWQLANEPRPGRAAVSSEKNLPDFYRWIDQTALYIHSLDTNHLVSSGSEGTIGTLQSSEFFLKSHQTPPIDYLTFHLWPMNWGWFDPKRVEETLPVTETKALDYISSHLDLARQLNKPLVMEEFGLDRDGGEINPGSPVTVRDRYFRMILEAIHDSAQAGSPMAGCNFWGWGGEATARHPDGIWRIGDPFLSDPPHEPQGRNSIFLSDTSTLRIIRESAIKMMRLGTVDSLLVKPNR
jgi:mannan endo-1,4-beta-mannosidase